MGEDIAVNFGRPSASPVDDALARGRGVVGEGLGRAAAGLRCAGAHRSASTRGDRSAAVAAGPLMTTIGASTSRVTLVSQNSARKALVVFKQSPSILYASTKTGFTKGAAPLPVAPQSRMILNEYTGALYGVWDAAVGHAQVTEV